MRGRNVIDMMANMEYWSIVLGQGKYETQEIALAEIQKFIKYSYKDGEVEKFLMPTFTKYQPLDDEHYLLAMKFLHRHEARKFETINAKDPNDIDKSAPQSYSMKHEWLREAIYSLQRDDQTTSTPIQLNSPFKPFVKFLQNWEKYFTNSSESEE